MSKINNHLQKLQEKKLSVIVRTDTKIAAQKIIEQTVNNGFHFVEITLTVPDAFNLISETKQKFPKIMIGAGTVLNLNDAKIALANGADYLVSPVFNDEILQWSLAKDILYIPGAMTVNEIYLAVQKNAPIVKVYPAMVLQPQAFKIIKQPFPNFKLLATGGINLTNVRDYLLNGALAVGITFDPKLLNNSDNKNIIADQAIKYCQIVNEIMIKE